MTFNLPYLSTITLPNNDTITFEYKFHPNPDDNFYGPPENLRYEPYKVIVCWNGGQSVETYTKGPSSFTGTSGSADMHTMTTAGTVNTKRYSLELDRGSMQWIGLEMENKLEGVPHHRYEYSADRLLPGSV
jgi:hypothetical protein